MHKLYVLYDHTCAFCRSCRDWLDNQPKFIEMEFIAARSPKAVAMFPDVDAPQGCVEKICSTEPAEELTPIKEAPTARPGKPEIPVRCPKCRVPVPDIQRLYHKRECKYCGADLISGVNNTRFAELMPEIERTKKKEIERPSELIVISDDGGVYRGGQAFIICLYALEDYREISEDLATPEMLPLARRGFEMLSRNRSIISTLLTLGGEKIDRRGSLAAV